MKALSSTSWGASSRILRLFYVAYIRSRLEYASVIFTGVAAPLKNKLKVIQNVCLRLILGARNTTPIRSMEVEANIAPLDARQDYLLAKLYCTIDQQMMRLLQLQVESGSSVVGTNNNFKRRATFALLNIGMQ